MAIAHGIAGKEPDATEGKSDGNGFEGVAEDEFSVGEAEEVGAAAGIVGDVQIESSGTSSGGSGAEEKRDSCNGE